MKIRTGFVSNSSSSSFVLRGIPVTKEQLIEALKISQEEIDNVGEYEIIEVIGSKLRPWKKKYGDLERMKAQAQGIILEEEDINYDLDVEPTGNYFGNLDFDNLILGKHTGGFDDGEVTEVGCDEPTDNQILENLSKLGFSGPLKTYVQMVSNDNY